MGYSIKKGDYVKIIAGKDKGKMAQVIGVNTDSGRIILEGKDIAMAKKAIKARKANDKSGIISMAKPISISNVMPVCAACGKTTRVKNAVVDGKKVRMCGCGVVLETKKVATKEEKKAKAAVRKKAKVEETAVAETPVTEATVAPVVSEVSIDAAAVETAETKAAPANKPAVKKAETADTEVKAATAKKAAPKAESDKTAIKPAAKAKDSDAEAAVKPAAKTAKAKADAAKE